MSADFVGRPDPTADDGCPYEEMQRAKDDSVRASVADVHVEDDSVAQSNGQDWLGWVAEAPLAVAPPFMGSAARPI